MRCHLKYIVILLFCSLYLQGCFVDEPAVPTDTFNTGGTNPKEDSSEWRYKNVFPFPVANALAFAVNGKAYVGTGLLSVQNTTEAMYYYWEYDAAKNEWGEKNELSNNGIWQSAGFEIDDVAYIGTGRSADPIIKFDYILRKDFRKITLSTAQPIRKMADLPGVPREQAIAFAINGKGYILGGIGHVRNSTGTTQRGYLNDLWAYDPVQNTWDSIGTFPGGGIANAVSFMLGDKVYVGLGEGNNAAVSKNFWVFNAKGGTWDQKPIPFEGNARYDAVGFTIEGSAYVGLGQQPGADISYADFWRYDSKTQKWTPQAAFPGGVRAGAVGVVVNGSAFVGLGYVGKFDDYKFKNDWYQFTPKK